MEVAELDRLDDGLRSRHRPAQDAADAQQQFARLEGLRQIVVGTDLEAGQAIGEVGARGQHEDRQLRCRPRRPRPDGLRQFEAGLARHHHVEDDEVEGQAFQPLAGCGGMSGRRDAIAVVGEVARQRLADHTVIIDDEQMGRVVLGRRWWPPAASQRSFAR